MWYGKESIPIWGYGANFDVVILESAYRALDMNIDERPQVTNYIGECFVKIANHLAYKSNFVNYTFHSGVKKSTSQGVGGRGRKVKISTSTMNKNRKRSYKKYRGQGR